MDNFTYLGGEFAGGKLKETGYVHWLKPNTGATSESGFTTLPSGLRYNSGTYELFTSTSLWWASTEYSTATAYYWEMWWGYDHIYHHYDDKGFGLPVRCIKDN